MIVLTKEQFGALIFQIGISKGDQLTPAERKLADELASDGLSIQDKFRSEPLYKQTGKGHFASETVKELQQAKKSKPKGGKS